MITKLSSTDYQSVLFHLKGREKEFHFFIAALENSHEKKLFCSTSDGEKKLFILISSSLIIHLAGETGKQNEVFSFINNLEWRILISPSSLLAEMEGKINFLSDDKSLLMALEKEKCPQDCRQARILKSPEAFYALTCLYDRIDGYSDIYSGSREDFIIERLEQRQLHSQIVAAIGGKRLISSAGRNADLILSVCTDPEYRKKGYASKVLRRLINHAFISDPSLKRLYLFCQTEEAKRLYLKLGFENVVSYDVLKR